MCEAEEKLKQIRAEFDAFTRKLGELQFQSLMTVDHSLRSGQAAKDSLKAIGQILNS